MGNRLIDEIERAAERGEGPGGEEMMFVGVEAVKDLARDFHIRPRQIELCALSNGYIPSRYSKNIGSIGIDGQIRLLESKAAVVGAGGIGGNVAEMLARMGVGTIALADADDFEDSNLNRQTFSTEDLIGHSKVEAARQRLWDVNSSVLVVPHHVRVTEENLHFIIGNSDIVIDALDNLRDRLMLQRACSEMDKIMIHGAVAGSAVQVMTIFPGDRGLNDLYGREAIKEDAGIEIIAGNLSTAPAAAASLQAHETLRLLLGEEPAFRHRLLFLDLNAASFEWIDLSPPSP